MTKRFPFFRMPQATRRALASAVFLLAAAFFTPARGGEAPRGNFIESLNPDCLERDNCKELCYAACSARNHAPCPDVRDVCRSCLMAHPPERRGLRFFSMDESCAWCKANYPKMFRKYRCTFSLGAVSGGAAGKGAAPECRITCREP